ncbi:hypothetical protein [Hyphomicrobium sp.]|uniref:hypothetical protein n=1 Tax=Hyphomicrobium sp. TaxID=82 RepID=UPI0025BD6F1D|nr:hypothetical protein [Hyphomicrobium sp.]MCC7251272.1 hypothetical protein [Hyphomicrobium sp.]
MDKPDATTDQPTSIDTPAGPSAAALDVAADDAFHLELAAGPILADILSSEGAAEGHLEDLHAALASLPNDALDHFDAALEHLTHAVDLFDVPASHVTADASDDAS